MVMVTTQLPEMGRATRRTGVLLTGREDARIMAHVWPPGCPVDLLDALIRIALVDDLAQGIRAW
jgi:hypothetical protein